MIDRRKPPKLIDLHSEEWEPPIGNDPLPGQKPHIWQEFKRDLHMKRTFDVPTAGRGWPILLFLALIFVVQFAWETGAGPEWLLALRNLF